MRKLNLVLLIVILGSSVLAQIPKEAFDLTNSLSTSLSDGKIDEAVEDMVKLNELYRPFFVERMHNSVAQYINSKTLYYDEERGANSESFLQKLYEKDNPEINTEIWPLVSLIDMYGAKSPRKKKKEAAEFLEQLPKSDSDWGNATRYAFLVRNVLREEGLDKDQIYNDLSQRIIEYLSTAHEQKPDDQSIRYFLSYYYFTESEKHPGEKEKFLKMASDYSPDHTSNAFFYDMIFLDPVENRPGFKQVYLDFLIGENKYDEALGIVLNMAVASPVDSKLQQLEMVYNKVNDPELPSFSDYWKSAIYEKAKPLPTTWFVNDQNDTVSIWSPTEKWTFIDVWGTWCSPCVKELPDFQVYYDSIQARTESPLEIVTWGFDQQEKFDKFMEENEYEFPIINVTMDFQKQFKINSWPTKILITPEGRYFKIPFGQDYKMWIKNCVVE